MLSGLSLPKNILWPSELEEHAERTVQVDKATIGTRTGEVNTPASSPSERPLYHVKII
jgi:hypothetical protein